MLREDISEAFKQIGKAPGPSEVHAEMIQDSGDVGISVDETLKENTRWKKNASRIGYHCGNYYY